MVIHPFRPVDLKRRRQRRQRQRQSEEWRENSENTYPKVLFKGVEWVWVMACYLLAQTTANSGRRTRMNKPNTPMINDRKKQRERQAGPCLFSTPEPLPPQILFSPLDWKQSDSTTTMRTLFRSLRVNRASKHLGTLHAQLKPFLLVQCRFKGHENSHKISSTRSKHGQKVTKHTS